MFVQCIWQLSRFRRKKFCTNSEAHPTNMIRSKSIAFLNFTDFFSLSLSPMISPLVVFPTALFWQRNNIRICRRISWHGGLFTIERFEEVQEAPTLCTIITLPNHPTSAFARSRRRNGHNPILSRDCNTANTNDRPWGRRQSNRGSKEHLGLRSEWVCCRSLPYSCLSWRFGSDRSQTDDEAMPRLSTHLAFLFLSSNRPLCFIHQSSTGWYATTTPTKR